MSDIFNMADTWDQGPTTFTAIKMNVTDTASNANSLLIDLQVAAASQFKVSKGGAVTSAGGILLKSSNNTGISLSFYNNELQLGSELPLSWSSINPGGGNGDLYLYRDAANTLAQRRSTNAQTFRVYNTYTDASNYERGSVGWVSNSFVITSERAGTGASRSLVIDSGEGVQINTTGVSRWIFQTGTGHLLPLTDNAIDIGANATNRSRDLHLGRNFVLNMSQSLGGGVGVMNIGNASTAPTTNPTGGGILYCEAGALKFRGTSGTVTTIAAA